VQANQIQTYQDKMNQIYDDAEETEEAIKREYELKLLHFETKYLREKNEKNTLQQQLERLKQRLFVQQQELNNNVSAGYDTMTTATTPKIDRVVSNNSTVIVNSEHSTPRKRANSTNTTCSSSSYSSSSSSSTSTSCSTSSSSSTESTNISNTKSSESESDDDGMINTEPSKKYNYKQRKYEKGKYEKGTKRKKKKKNRNRHNSHKEKPKGFWNTVWSLFGPPDLMCSCSENK